MRKKLYDIIGIGTGPFNLGLAALCFTIPNLDCLFIDQNDSFNWHPGLLFDWAKLQVPFYADLVTLADPTNPFTYLAFLKAKGQLFRFGILEDYFIKRKKYNEYCRWVAGQLNSLRFNTKCEEIIYTDCYEVKTNKETFYAKNVVIGIGSVPAIPGFINFDHPLLLHSSEFLYKKSDLLKQRRITIVGSGQSAAEIFYDLLQSYTGEIYWFTRSDRFYAMDYSKFALDMATPDYIDHFYTLPAEIKAKVLQSQDYLYKGINQSLVNEIYALLEDNKSAHLHSNCELVSVTNEFELSFRHKELQEIFLHLTGAVILATGYKNKTPDFMEPYDGINRDYSLQKGLFIQNAELRTHGFNAADLGLGPYRNAVILNTILEHEHYPMESKVAFQRFGKPG